MHYLTPETALMVGCLICSYTPYLIFYHLQFDDKLSFSKLLFQSTECVCSLVCGMRKLSVTMKILSDFQPQQELGRTTKTSSEIGDVPKFNKCEACVFISLNSFLNCQAVYSRM